MSVLKELIHKIKLLKTGVTRFVFEIKMYIVIRQIKRLMKMWGE